MDYDLILMGIGTSKAARKSEQQVNLPLRQAMQQRQPEPKIYDITEKFTRACNGKAHADVSMFSCYLLFSRAQPFLHALSSSYCCAMYLA